MTRHSFSKRLPEAAQVDYILFARADVALQPNPDEVRAVRYVDAAALRDMMDPASGLRWSPWFRCEAGTRTAESGAHGTYAVAVSTSACLLLGGRLLQHAVWRGCLHSCMGHIHASQAS